MYSIVSISDVFDMEAKAETLLVIVAYLYIVDSRLSLDRDHSASTEQVDMLTSPNRHGVRDGDGVGVGVWTE